MVGHRSYNDVSYIELLFSILNNKAVINHYLYRLFLYRSYKPSYRPSFMYRDRVVVFSTLYH